MQKTFSKHQQFKIDTDGFAFLKKKQIEKLLKDQVVKNDDEINMEIFDYYDEMNDQQIEEALWLTIEHIAENFSLEVCIYFKEN